MGGSKKITTGYRYHGGIVQAICAGPVDTLHAILNADTVIWEGPLQRATADPDGKTIINTSLGVIKFYWGTTTQTTDTDLAGALIDYGGGPVAVAVPPWRGVCYAVSKRLEFGQQNSPPILHFDITKQGSALALSTHEIGGDAVLPEVIYEYLTDPVWGLGVDPGDIDTESFVAASETVIAEGIGVSPTCDSTGTVREFLGQLLSYIDGVLVYRHGKLRLKLIRKESTAGLPVLDEGDLLDEPKPLNECFGDTWNLTRVTFTDRDNKYEQGVESFDDPANADLVGEAVPRDINFPFVRRRSVAKILAKRIGIKGGVPALSWQFDLKPQWHDLAPGDLVFMTYPKLGITNRLLRITRVGQGAADRPSVEIDAVEEIARDGSHDYIPLADNFAVPPRLMPGGIKPTAPVTTNPRVSWLPGALKVGKPDGLLVACQRPDGYSTMLELWWTYDPARQAFTQLDLAESFPAKGQLLAWHRVRGSHWLIRVRMESQLDYDRLLVLIASGGAYAVAGQRLFRQSPAKDEHQVLALWLPVVSGGYASAQADLVIDLEVAGAGFGTADLAFEGEASDGRYPTTHLYFGRQEDFLVHATDSIQFERDGANAPVDPATGESFDTGLVRYFRTPVRKPKWSQRVADAGEVTYDRDSTSMCPDGSFSRDWGSRVQTAYEQIDRAAAGEVTRVTTPGYATFADFDTALRAIWAGTATADHSFVAADLDLLLAAVSLNHPNRYAP